MMTAHAHLAQMLPDGTIRASYVHIAEPEAEIGPVLAQGYTDAEHVAALLDLGDLRTVDTTIRSCRAYGRDGGETGTEARIYPDIDALLDAAATSSVVYLFRDGQWLVWVRDGEWYRLKPNGYVAWHGLIVPLIDEVITTAESLGRPFEQEEVIYPLWDAGHGFMLHLDDRFQIHSHPRFSACRWILKKRPRRNVKSSV